MPSCCASLEEIQRACEEGRGTTPGLGNGFYIACEDKITSIPARDAYPGEGMLAHTVTADIVMVTDEVFVKIAWDNTLGQNSWKVEEQGEGQSKYYVTTATGFIPGISGKVAYVTNGLLTGEYICIVPDAEGLQRIIGKKGSGCTVSVGEQNDSKNGQPVTITWRSSEKPLFYTGAIAE